MKETVINTNQKNLYDDLNSKFAIKNTKICLWIKKKKTTLCKLRSVSHFIQNIMQIMTI